MRIIVTGQSGIDKSTFLDSFKKLCDTKKLPSTTDGFAFDSDVVLDKNILNHAKIDHIFDLEHEMCKKNKWLTPNYLDKPISDLLHAKNCILKDLIKKSRNDNNTILAMHLNYLRKSSLYQILDWKELREFKPEMVIILIDDIYSIKNRIDNRNSDDDYVRAMSLKDIAWWREAEIAASKNLADNLLDENIPFYIVAVAHGPQILYQLMFESKHAIENKWKKIVYASYPISLAKTDKNLQTEANRFIKLLKKNFIVFVPGTIKEKILHDKFVENFQRPVPHGIIKVDNEQYQINDIAPVIVDINGQIITRDERLIDQSQAIFAYRPAQSIGSQFEIQYAIRSGSIITYVYHPSKDGSSPFVTGAKVIDDFKTFLDEIKKYAKST